MRCQIGSAKSGRLAIVSSGSPYEFLLGMLIISTKVHILNTSVQPAKKVCTYCLCSQGVYQCAECFRYHPACSENNLSTPSCIQPVERVQEWSAHDVQELFVVQEFV